MHNLGTRLDGLSTGIGIEKIGTGNLCLEGCVVSSESPSRVRVEKDKGFAGRKKITISSLAKGK